MNTTVAVLGSHGFEAFGTIIAAAHRAQADALEIEAQAKRRLADEYDAAQARGEVAGPATGRPKSVPDGNALPAVSDLGLTRKAVHEARQLRDAEAAAPGVIRRTLDARLADGRELSKAVAPDVVAYSAWARSSAALRRPHWRARR